MKRLEVMHTRVVRRFAGPLNGKKLAVQDPDNPHTANESVRRFLGAPSVQCCVQQGRLRYVAHLIRHAPIHFVPCCVIRPLASSQNGLPLSSMTCVPCKVSSSLSLTSSPTLARMLSPGCPRSLSSPGSGKSLYLNSGTSPPHSSLPTGLCLRFSAQAKPLPTPTPSLAHFALRRPLVFFSNTRALNTHQMKVQGLRREARFFVDTGLCPACGHDYITRARALEHVTRRRQCSVAISPSSQ